jgi:hypothetical protein
MDDPSYIRVPANDGRLMTLMTREKGRPTEKGVEGIVYALLDPNTRREVGEFWAPTADQSEPEPAIAS